MCEHFEQWYAARIVTVNKGGILDVLLTLPLVKQYLREAYEAGYKAGDDEISTLWKQADEVQE